MSEVFGPHGIGMALREIQSGVCDKALVVAAGLTFFPKMVAQLRDLHIMSPDGLCHSFEEAGASF